MAFETLTCPACNAPLRDIEKSHTIRCTYCGSDILRDSLAGSRNVQCSNLEILAVSALETGRVAEAYGYFTELLKDNASNPDYWLGFAAAAGGLSTISDLRIDEMLRYIENALACSEPSKTDLIQERGAVIITKICASIHINSRRAAFEYASLDDSWSNHLAISAQLLAAMESAHEYSPKDTGIIEVMLIVCKENIEGMEFRDQYNEGLPRVRVTPKERANELLAIMQTNIARFQNIDPAFKAPQIEKAKACFIATAASGDPCDEHVILLQQFRDKFLAKSVAGRRAIAAYGIWGPLAASIIERSRLLKAVVYLALVVPSASILKVLVTLDK
ncbi:hypothetical protein BH09SUM1_BH09SUM1_05560 [soil metagenome]